MSPPDNADSEPGNVPAAWPRPPLASAGMDGSLLRAIEKGAAAAIWALADGAPLWWNEAGAALFDLPRTQEMPELVAAAIGRAGRSDRLWLERWRLCVGRRPLVATLLLGRARLEDASEGLVAVATAGAPALAPDGRAVPPDMPDFRARVPEAPPSPSLSRPSGADIPDRPGAQAAVSQIVAQAAGVTETIAHPLSRRLTWQTDASGRLLAGPPGTSLSQALGRGAPMQPALLGELFEKGGAAVEAEIAAGRPVAGVPVVTLPAPDGSSFVGQLFGAPVLDQGRRITGYRGFLVISGVRSGESQPSVSLTPPDASTDAPEDSTGRMGPEGDRGAKDAVGDEKSLPATTLPPAGIAASPDAEQELVEASMSSHVSREAQAAVLGRSAVTLASAAWAQGETNPMLLARSQMPSSPMPTGTSGQSEPSAAAAPKPVEAPLRSSNVITLRPPSTDAARLREQEAPALSPAERDAFADIAKALGATWVMPSERPAEAAASGNGRDEEAARRNDSALAEAEGSASASERVEASDPRASGAEPQAFAGASAGDLAAVVHRLPVGILVHRTGVALAANKTLLDLLGHSSFEEFERHGGIDKLFAEPDDPRRNGKRVAIRARDGEVIEVDARCQAIKWGGEAATLLSLRRSLLRETESLEAAHRSAIAAKEAEIGELRALLDGAADGIVSIDGLGRILAMNPSAEKLFGYGAGEIAGEALAVLIAPESHQALAAALGEAHAGTSRPASIEITGRERNGRRISLSMKLYAGNDVWRSVRWHAAFRDLTASKDSEAGLVEARVAAERTTAQKSEFLAKVSHEIRTPLNSIVGFADIIAEERFGPLENERYKEYVKDIRASGTHIISLVNDLLDLSKIESGRMELSFTAVNLNAEVGAGVALVQLDAARSRVLLRQSLAQGLPAIIADARSIKQIALNVLSNAVKFTEPGGQVIVSTAISEEGEVILRVRDTGIGMSERELAEAMEPFRQFATTLRPGGSGLGLSLTKALVKANHANLSIASNANEGTLVEVVFPRARVMAV
jgi:PAS domain S-box-containing protein